MNAEVIDRYLELKKQLATIQEEIDKLKPKVIDYVSKSGGKLEYSGVCLYKQVSRTWQFSEEVLRLEKNLKEKKRGEIDSGKATFKKETVFVVVRPMARVEKKGES